MYEYRDQETTRPPASNKNRGRLSGTMARTVLSTTDAHPTDKYLVARLPGYLGTWQSDYLTI